MTFEKTHQNVENSNIFFQTPQIGDVVKAFNKMAVITHDFSDSNERQPFAVAFIEGGEGMPFRSEIEVIWKRQDNFNQCKINEINAMQHMQVIATLFDKEVN
jgi:hypothetical protein